MTAVKPQHFLVDAIFMVSQDVLFASCVVTFYAFKRTISFLISFLFVRYNVQSLCVHPIVAFVDMLCCISFEVIPVLTHTALKSKNAGMFPVSVFFKMTGTVS